MQYLKEGHIGNTNQDLERVKDQMQHLKFYQNSKSLFGVLKRDV